MGPSTEPASCVRPVVASAVPSSWVQTFGTRRVGDVVKFSVPANAQSATIFSQAVSSVDSLTYQGSPLQNSIIPALLVGPAPQLSVYYDVSAAPPSDPATAYAWLLTGAVSSNAVTLPNTSAMLSLAHSGLPSGTWQYTVNDYAYMCSATSQCTGGRTNDTYDVQVVVKPGPPVTVGTFDAAFYLVDATGISGATASGNVSVQRMVKTLAGIYAKAGICLGKVTFYDVPKWVKDKYEAGINIDDTSPCGDLSQLFTLSADANAVHYFLVPSILSSSLQSGFQIVGMDGSIPGPSGYGGTVASGAAVSMADLTAGTCGTTVNTTGCGADSVAYVAAHEGGHWLGLFHTTESTGDGFDPLDDTGTCSCLSCATAVSQCNGKPGITSDNAHLMTGTECTQSTACSGGDNLMFWLANQNSKAVLTAEQGRIMRSNLVVH